MTLKHILKSQKGIENIVSKTYFSVEAIYHFSIPFLRFIPNKLFARKTHKYLFILTPPHAGSTILTKYLTSSRNVSCNNNYGTSEGLSLPQIRRKYPTYDNNPKINCDFQIIRTIWHKHWNLSKTILLDKSPPNISRAKQLAKSFKPTYGIILVRDPYAICESLMRRSKWSAQRSAEFVVTQFEYQVQNESTLKRTLIIRYEDFCDKSDLIKKNIISFIPELGDVKEKKTYFQHNVLNVFGMKLQNLNAIKIKNIKREDKQVIRYIFLKHKIIFKKFGYDI